ncbi:MAG: DUF4062 domain-containing protein [Myxococcota bacterium]
MAEVKKAMISSTSRDLPEHRDQARDACLSQGVFPLMMEHLPATDSDAIAVSLRMVTESDVYLGIFGRRYGYVPQGHAISITEMEYDRALELGIPRLIFIMANEHAPIDEPPESEEKAQKLDALKARLRSEAIVSLFKSPDDLRAHLHHSLARYKESHPTTEYRPTSSESAYFSRPIQEQMARLNKAIDQLTKDQFKVIDFLSGHRRVAITGGAGTGKTLVATEKAIRMAHAGMRTLMMCHNPHLATHIRNLVAGTQVEVAHFAEWVAKLVGKPYGFDDSWSHFAEPLEADLDEAFDILMETDRRYDAIIVDEAQDFRDEWWLVVEAALENPEHDILYIFHDNNQALLPHRARYPVVQSPIVLTQNCRNAGEVFDVVTAFHYRLRQTPPSELLQREGIYRKWIVQDDRPIQAVHEAIQTASSTMDPSQLVVLTPDDLGTSPLNGLEVPIEFAWRWQDKIRYYFDYLPREFSSPLRLPPLSEALTPTPADVRAVVNIAERTLRSIQRQAMPFTVRPKWVVDDRGLRLRPSHLSNYERLQFFATEDWAATLPEPPKLRLLPASLYQGHEHEVLLASVSAFKGLESDGVVLCALRPHNQLRANLYVGASRARYLLHLVIDPRSNAQLPRHG